MSTRATFDLCGPLPEGTTVLEASAGTGKTHTIAGLACRYLAEGVARIDELMLVTFGRAATAVRPEPPYDEACSNRDRTARSQPQRACSRLLSSRSWMFVVSMYRPRGLACCE